MSPISRRRFFGYGLGAAVVGAAPLTAAKTALAAPTPAQEAEAFFQSIANAARFQNMMMDSYATGATVRLIQSYADQSGLESTAFTYDNAVSIHAYLLEGSADSLSRANVLGQGLIYAQANNFPFNDGRFAQAYFVNTASGSGAFITPAAFPFFFYTSAVGDQAWAGMALAQLYARTQNAAYLTAALSVANWIVNNTYDTQGPGGYRFGANINQFNQSVPSPNGKSTEHNIDTYAFFAMLDALTHHGSASNGMSWSALAAHALGFVAAMYNASGPFFWTGTLGDQVSINYYPIPEDCQTWSYLATLNSQYEQTIDWALANLQATDTASAPHSSLTGSESFTGMVFDSASLNTTAFDPDAVWLEGTSHTIAALTARAFTGRETFQKRLQDLQTAAHFVNICETAQTELGAGQTVAGVTIPTGQGLVASTSVMDTGFGYTYGPSKHIGATGWYLIAAFAGNPFRLGYRS
ncbi:MAG TPA: hypothetical protein VKB38_15540 [Terracidiphilus sp.]|nr:hypothetical protein [Terracidiphilus sp.]